MIKGLDNWIENGLTMTCELCGGKYTQSDGGCDCEEEIDEEPRPSDCRFNAKSHDTNGEDECILEGYLKCEDVERCPLEIGTGGKT